MIILKSVGVDQDSGALINFHLNAGRKTIVLDGSNGPFDILTPIEISDDNITITSGWRLPQIAGIKSGLEIRREFEPILRKNPDFSTMINVNGSGITISGLTLDYFMKTGWINNRRIISHTFDPAQITPRPLNGNVYEYLTFIDTYYAIIDRATKTGTKDIWGIVWTHRHEDGINNMTVRNCRSVTPGYQLTAGGAGFGVNGILIEDNYISNGVANSIAVTMKFADEELEDSGGIIQNVTIRNNRTYEVNGNGIFVGMDGNDPDKFVNLKSILIENNEIWISNEKQFGTGVRIKLGSDSQSTGEDIVIRNNYINATRNTQSPRFISARAEDFSPKAEISYYNNTFIGTAATVFNGDWTQINTSPPIEGS
jgi:hypothetical protein